MENHAGIIAIAIIALLYLSIYMVIDEIIGRRTNKKSKREMVIDFIKAWFYYPKMQKWCEKSLHVRWPDTRFEYAWWWCHIGRLK